MTTSCMQTLHRSNAMVCPCAQSAPLCPLCQPTSICFQWSQVQVDSWLCSTSEGVATVWSACTTTRPRCANQLFVDLPDPDTVQVGDGVSVGDQYGSHVIPASAMAVRHGDYHYPCWGDFLKELIRSLYEDGPRPLDSQATPPSSPARAPPRGMFY